VMRVGIATDRGALDLKEGLAKSLRNAGYQVVDIGAFELDLTDDCPEFIIPLRKPLRPEMLSVAWH
jgi:ribose 5-phosphate isomerase B